MNREFILNGQEIGFRYDGDAQGGTVTLGNETHDLVLQELAGGRFVIRNSSGQKTARAVRHRDRIWVWLDGQTYDFHVPSTDDGSSGHGAAAGNDVRAPMPGQLVKLFVGEGDEVEERQVVAVVEAMKMEHPLRAPRAGRVESVSGVVGQTVDADEVIVRLAISD